MSDSRVPGRGKSHAVRTLSAVAVAVPIAGLAAVGTATASSTGAGATPVTNAVPASSTCWETIYNRNISGTAGHHYGTVNLRYTSCNRLVKGQIVSQSSRAHAGQGSSG